MVAYDGIWQLEATFGSMWLHMHLNGFIRFKYSNMVSFGFLQMHIVDQSCMFSHTVSNGSIWFYAIYVLVICIYILVVCGSIWFHKVVYSQIWFHLVLTTAYCGLELHVVANGSLFVHNVSCYICTCFFIVIWQHIISHCSILLPIVIVGGLSTEVYYLFVFC